VFAGGFLAQRGRDARPHSSAALGAELRLESEEELGLEPAAVEELFATEPVRMCTGIELPPPGRFDRLLVFLSLYHPGMSTLAASLAR
jgi:hypothetical protein